jgi:hypothetical protein
MIIKTLCLIDNKLILNKFLLCQSDKFLTIKSIDHVGLLIKIPIYNKYNGIDYYPITFPLSMPIYKKQVFNPFIILSSFNFNYDNDIDFFYKINKILENKFELNFMKFDDLLKDTNNLFFKIISENYINYLNFDILKNITDLNIFIRDLWLCINLSKLFIIYILIKNPYISKKNIKENINRHNLPKKIFIILNHIKTCKYNITSTNNEYTMTFSEFWSFNFNSSIKLNDLKPNNCYYIIINKPNDSSTTDIVQTNDIIKVIKININSINKNIININPNNKYILYENYKWYNFHPNINIDHPYITYQSFLNEKFTYDIIKYSMNIDESHIFKIIEYYLKENKISNLIIFGQIFNNFKESFNDLNILKLNSYSDGFFEYITKKYSDPTDNKIYDILEILFQNYNYPLKNNRHEFDTLFDYILYFSLYNYKHIFINNKFTNNEYKSHSNIDLLHPNINSIIPLKLKNFYINLLKVLIQLINDDYESITYNQKFYSDYLHRNIIKILIYEYSNMSINLLKNLIKPSSWDRFKNIIQTNILLIDIGNKLTWINLPKKLNYLNIYYKNNDIIHYQNKMNKNIISDNFDYRIKKIIENPFEMYKYIRKEKDFIKWTKFISDKIIQIYLVPISLSSEDIISIGKMIFLLFNINEQNIKDESYINFINFSNSNNKIILESNRINIKIRDFFPTLKCNINLGFLAKHLTWNKESITFIENKIEKSSDILAIELKLQITTKKYYKYKAKYLESKNVEINSITKYNNNYIIDKSKILVSDTSSIIPGKEKPIL